MAQVSVKSAQEHAADFSPKMRTVALVVVALAFIMDLLDNTIVNVAIPTIQTNLLASYSAIQWIIAGYSLAFALILVTGGRMGDVYGYKKVFMAGVAGFTIASLLSGVSVSAGMLIASRILQGAFAALMVPQVMSLMQVMYKPEERGSINGLFGALGGISASLGPVVGGLLIKANIFNLDWRPIFLINVPIGIFGLVMAVKYLPDGKSPHPLKLDFVGTGIIVAAMFLLVYPLIQGRELDWPAWTFIMMAASLPFLALFVYWQRRKERTDGSPLVLPSLFKNRSFSVGLILNLIFESAMIGFFLTLTLAIQIGLGFSAIHAALTGLPIAVAIAIVMGALGEKVIPKLGRTAFNLGAFLMAAGVILTVLTYKHYQLGLHSWQLIGGLLIFGAGMGMVFGALFAAVLNGVDARHAGSASGTLNAVQQIGGAIGTAVIGVIFFGQLSSAAPASYQTAAPALKAQLAALHLPAAAQQKVSDSVQHCFVDRSREKDTSVIPASCKQVTAQSYAAIGKAAENAALKATAANFANAFKWAGVYEVSLLVVTFILAFMLPFKFKAEAYGEI